MPLPSSGALSLGDVNVELGSARGTQIALGQTTVRTLYGVASGSIRLAADGYGKSSAFIFNQTISSNTNDYNLRNAAIAAGWNQVLVLQATVTINSGVFVGSTSTGSAGFTTGSTFPAGSTLSIINNGYIVGRGGNGGSAQSIIGSAGGGGGGVLNGSAGTAGSSLGNGGANGSNTSGGGGGARVSTSQPQPTGGSANFSGTAGSSGGLALLVQYATTITNNGTIGGGGGGGGGGSGTIRFIPNAQLLVVVAGSGGNGGGLGTAGSAGETITTGANGGAGGSAGAAVSGNSNITWLATGTRLGAIS